MKEWKSYSMGHTMNTEIEGIKYRLLMVMK